MSFVIVERSVATAPIKVFVYDDKGKQLEVSFVAQYTRHTKSQVDQLRDGVTNRFRKETEQDLIKSRDGTIAEFPYDSDLDFIREKMCGWLQVKDQAGKAIAFDLKTFDKTIEDFPELVQPLFNGFFEAHQGARQKN